MTAINIDQKQYKNIVLSAKLNDGTKHKKQYIGYELSVAVNKFKREIGRLNESTFVNKP